MASKKKVKKKECLLKKDLESNPVPSKVKVPNEKKYPCKKRKGDHYWKIYAVSTPSLLLATYQVTKGDSIKEVIKLDIVCIDCWKLGFVSLERAKKLGLLVEEEYNIPLSSIKKVVER